MSLIAYMALSDRMVRSVYMTASPRCLHQLSSILAEIAMPSLFFAVTNFNLESSVCGSLTTDKQSSFFQLLTTIASNDCAVRVAV
jgi:hypothetical protein